VGNININVCYEKYAPMIFRRCLGILKNEEDALDAAQDVFAMLLTHRERLHDKFLSSLLYTMATNICLNRLRQRKKQGVSSPDMEALSPAEHDS
jgi:RNA polymerase sigma-70 factor (ECF subfamily)